MGSVIESKAVLYAVLCAVLCAALCAVKLKGIYKLKPLLDVCLFLAGLSKSSSFKERFLKVVIYIRSLLKIIDYTLYYKSIDKELDDVLEFGDVLSSLNIKQLTTLKEALHLDTMSQKRYLRKAYPETDRDGGMLLNAYSACSLVKDPNDYINYELDKRLDKLLNPQIDKAHNNYYTFMYCYLHNSGFIIHGKHERLSNNYTMLPDYNCGCGSWYFKDIFMRINKGEIEHIENILENSSRVWGGHSFLIYMDKLTDEI